MRHKLILDIGKGDDLKSFSNDAQSIKYKYVKLQRPWMTRYCKALSLLIWFIIPYSFGYDDSMVELTSVSTSGRTLTLNRGQVENIGKDDFGFLIEKKQVGDDKFIYRPVAKLKVIKLMDRESIWIAYKVFYPSAITRRKSFLLLSETALLQGRQKLELSRMDLVTNKDPEQEVEDFMLEGDDLARKDQDYIVVGAGHKKEKHFDNDGKLIDVSKWQEKMGDDKLYIQGVYQGPHAEQFADRRRYRTFEKMVMAFLEKYNDPNYEPEQFYGRAAYTKIEDIGLRDSTYGLREIKNQQRAKEDLKKEEFYRKLKQKGGRWSEDYSDEEVSDILNQMTIVYEKDRRRALTNFPFKFQLFFSTGLNVLNNENAKDSVTNQSIRNDYEASVEGYPHQEFKRLEVITAELSLRRANDGFFTGKLNAIIEETSIGLHLNYYPFKRMNTIEDTILYFGTHVRLGYARLLNNTYSEQGTYQVSSFPGLRVGLKYNFNNGFGVRLIGNYETIHVDRIYKAFKNGILPDRSSYQEAKVSIGLSKFF